MDSLTHIAVGACMGEAFAGKTVGRKALVWGALAQSIPDIDFVVAFWLDPASNLLAHRGFTHSFLFTLLITPVMAMLAEKWHRPHNISYRRWFFFFGSAIFIHLFLDAFNNYGVGWLEPFSQHRFTFNTIYVADPFFSIWLAISCFALIYLNARSRKLREQQQPWRQFWWRFGLFMSGLYLLSCVFNKMLIDRDVRSIFKKQNIPYTRYFTTPAPLQNWLWYIVAGNDEGYYIGYRSLFDRETNMHFEFFPRNAAMLDTIREHDEVQKLIRFSQEFYTVERWQDTLIFNDLRFGQIIGWQNPREKFAFHFFLEHPNDNKLVVQRGRFAKWDLEVMRIFWTRIQGQ